MELSLNDSIVLLRDRLSLERNQLRIFVLNADENDRLLALASGALPESEKKKADYFKTKKRRSNFIITQGVLRILLGCLLNKSPKMINISMHVKGKPFISDNNSLHFNISNSGNCCIYAFSDTTRLGIDIEEIRLLEDVKSLILNNFKKGEIDWINYKKGNKLIRFFQFWTIKEAYLKAIGEGMRLPPNNLEFNVVNGEFKLCAINGIFEQEDWIIKPIIPMFNYVGAVVYKGDNTKIHLTSLVI